VFLNLASVSQPFTRNTDLIDTKSLLALVEHLDCDTLKPIVLKRFYQLALYEPFEVLVFASSRNDVIMARRAMGFVTEFQARSLYRNGKDWSASLGRLSPAWQLALVHLLLRDTPFGHNFSYDWPALAPRFSPLA
jgi:hypothetical protein